MNTENLQMVAMGGIGLLYMGGSILAWAFGPQQIAGVGMGIGVLFGLRALDKLGAASDSSPKEGENGD